MNNTQLWNELKGQVFSVIVNDGFRYPGSSVTSVTKRDYKWVSHSRDVLMMWFMIFSTSQACPMFSREFDKALAAGVNIVAFIVFDYHPSLSLSMLSSSSLLSLSSWSSSSGEDSCCWSDLGQSWGFLLYKAAAHTWQSLIGRTENKYWTKTPANSIFTNLLPIDKGNFAFRQWVPT